MKISMRGMVIGVVAVFAAAVGLAQGARAQNPLAQGGSPGPDKLYSSAADVTALIERAKSVRKEGQANVVQPLLQLSPYSTNVEYRASVGNATVHVHEAEMFYVIEGSATMVTGGKLVGQTGPGGENLAGTGIEGGTSRKIGKGDFIMVPENTPHWFSAIDGVLVVMSMHVPRPFPAK
jgi:mannose-6-phosphate isomerase-like protein (cupin superfamily)